MTALADRPAAPTRARTPRRAPVRRLHPRVRRGLDYLLMGTVTLLFASPILYMFIGSLKPDDQVLDGLAGFVPRHLSLDNYADVFARFDDPSTGYFLDFLGTSVIVTGVVVLGGLVVNSLAAYSLARLRWRGRDAVLVLVLALAVLPFEAIAVPLFYLLNDFRNTLAVQSVPLVANAFSVFLFYSFFLKLPKEIEEAGRMDGAGPLRIFVQIIVPMSKPVFATVAILSFLTQWGMFLWPVLMVNDPAVRPLPLAISVYQGQPPFAWGDIMAFGVMMVLPMLVVFLVFQRWFVRSVATTGLKG
ncbi:carbohydrate ABC transporter permease [Nocardiopsis aegyptia]|uniref:Multiple sugar transport system permease protein n=1 Tax=Nocardiopsis aegyptia TaxID=220378 RepID=A0A7Z0EHR4_9ACTN|nr:carbohydrate ABC transporter permease [Nocardiopsis aegyptia]NYJ32300.1 multiple sugar transport system permease protein [Nocardiopsis aegyptia]